MAMRAIKLLREANIGLQTLQVILNALDLNDSEINPITLIPDDIANFVISLCYKDVDLFKLIEGYANLKQPSSQSDSKISLDVIGKIDLDEHNNPKGLIAKNQLSTIVQEAKQEFYSDNYPSYNDIEQDFWIEELIILSPTGKANTIAVGNFKASSNVPLYSVLIGRNGVGKSSIMKEIVDFFIDLHAFQNEKQSKLYTANKTRLKGIRYHIDGVCCEVVRMEKTFIAKIDGKLRPFKYLRLPSIVACHFGAFDKFPVQKVNGSAQTRYDIPQYKYVGAHVNGNLISSSAIAFRLLFILNENMDERQRLNIKSILDFIG